MDLGLFLERFEGTMRECEVAEEEWVDRLCARLQEKLCVWISDLRDEDAGYDAVKGALLKAAGETTITYGHRIFELTGESLKAKSGDEAMDVIVRLCKGLFQGAKSVEECVFALAMAITRQVIPVGGRTFLENKAVNSIKKLREGWCDWVSGRQRGNLYKVLGNSGSEGGRAGRGSRDGSGSSRFTVNCCNCGEAGHRTVDCKAGRTGSPNVDRVPGAVSRIRQPTCFTCHKEGHKSPDCPLKKVGGPVKQEPVSGRMAPVNKASVGKKEKNNVVVGRVNGVEKMILVDTGADLGVVPRTLVGEDAEDCGETYVSGVHGNTVLHKCTKAVFEVAGMRLVREVVIDKSGDSFADCILTLDLKVEEEVLAFMKAMKLAEVKVLTRSQARAETELERSDTREVSKGYELSVGESNVDGEECEPMWCVVEEVPEDKGDELEASTVEDSVVGEELSVDTSVEMVVGDTVEVEPEAVVTAFEDLVPLERKERQLCELAGDIGPVKIGTDGEKFREAVKADESLNEWRELGDRKERGFSWKGGTLVKEMCWFCQRSLGNGFCC